MDKELRTPIIDPLLLALKSRRVLVAICALIVGVLTLAVPELAHVRNEILTLVITLALAIIGGYSVEDAAKAGREKSVEPGKTVRDEVLEIIAGLFDEAGKVDPVQVQRLKK